MIFEQNQQLVLFRTGNSQGFYG